MIAQLRRIILGTVVQRTPVNKYRQTRRLNWRRRAEKSFDLPGGNRLIFLKIRRFILIRMIQDEMQNFTRSDIKHRIKSLDWEQSTMKTELNCAKKLSWGRQKAKLTTLSDGEFRLIFIKLKHNSNINLLLSYHDSKQCFCFHGIKHLKMYLKKSTANLNRIIGAWVSN